MDTQFIFVYGTLMTDCRNYKKYLSGRVISKKDGYVVGTLYHLVNKDYPAFIQVGDDRVCGEILEVSSDGKLIDELDELEGCRHADSLLNEYEKKYIEVFTKDGKLFGKLPTYVYNDKATANLSDEKVLVESSCWREFKMNEKM